MRLQGHSKRLASEAGRNKIVWVLANRVVEAVGGRSFIHRKEICVGRNPRPQKKKIGLCGVQNMDRNEEAML